MNQNAKSNASDCAAGCFGVCGSCAPELNPAPPMSAPREIRLRPMGDPSIAAALRSTSDPTSARSQFADASSAAVQPNDRRSIAVAVSADVLFSSADPLNVSSADHPTAADPLKTRWSDGADPGLPGTPGKLEIVSKDERLGEIDVDEADPCPCYGVGLSESVKARLKEAAEKAAKNEPLSQDDWDAIYEAICCGVLSPLDPLTDALGFLSPLIKPILTALGLQGGWVDFPGVMVEILAHVDAVHHDTGGWTSVDVTTYDVGVSDSQGGSSSKKQKGKMRVEIHPSDDPSDLDPPLAWCQFRKFRGELKEDTDGTGFMEVHVSSSSDGTGDGGGDDGGDDGGRGISPPGDAPPEANSSDWPPNPDEPVPPPRPDHPLPAPLGGGDGAPPGG